MVTVTDSEYAPGGCNRIRWQAARARGSTVLPDLLQIDLLSTERPGKQPFVTPDPEPEAGHLAAIDAYDQAAAEWSEPEPEAEP